MTSTKALELDAEDSEITFLTSNNNCTELHAPAHQKMNKFTIRSDWSIEQETFPFQHTDEVADSMLGMVRKCYIYVPANQNPALNKEIKVVEAVTNVPISAEQYRTRVIAIETCSNIVVIAVRDEIYIYHFYNYLNPDHVISYVGPLASSSLLSMQPGPNGPIMAYPCDTRSGRIRLHQIIGKRRLLEIKTNQSNLSCILLNSNATLVATASKQTCDVKIFRTNGDQMCEFGYNKDIGIDSLVFSPTSQFLACSLRSGTIHICKLYGGASRRLDAFFGTVQLPPTAGRFRVHGFIPAPNSVGNLGLVVSYGSMFVGIFEIDVARGGSCEEAVTYDVRRKQLLPSSDNSLAADTNV